MSELSLPHPCMLGQDFHSDKASRMDAVCDRYIAQPDSASILFCPCLCSGNLPCLWLLVGFSWWKAPKEKRAGREISSEVISSSVGHSSCQTAASLGFDNHCLPLSFGSRGGNIFLLSQAPGYFTILVNFL